jgi:hypothetical protein
VGTNDFKCRRDQRPNVLFENTEELEKINFWSLIQWPTIIIIIIIISLSQSTVGHRPLQYPAISLDLRQLASSSCQTFCANRHSTWPLRYVYLDAVSTPELVYPSGYRFYGWYDQPTATYSMLIRCAVSVTLVLCRITWFRIRSRRETPNLAPSVRRWATLNLWNNRAVSIHVSAPYVMTDQRCLTSTIARRSALTAVLSSSSRKEDDRIILLFCP